MDKRNKMEIYSKIRERFSPRNYSEKPVCQADIETLIDAARWSASSRNSQPWRFIIAHKTNYDSWIKLRNCLSEFNQQWANTAPVLILVLAQKIDPSTDSIRNKVLYDVGLAVGNLTNQANEMGIFLRNMGGFSSELTKNTFNIPDQFEPVVFLALGYLGESNYLDEKFQIDEGKNRHRRNLTQIIFNGNWHEMF